MSRILALIVLAVVVACASAQYYGSPYYGVVNGRSPYAAPLAHSAGYAPVRFANAYSYFDRGFFQG